MATRAELYPSRWLSAADVETPRVVTIAKCTIESVGSGVRAERKPIVYFVERSKPLIVNQTNYNSIVAINGKEDTDEWAGTTLELFALDVTGPNGPTRGVRVRRAKKAKPAPAAPPVDTTDDDEAVPF
jgi:hypothetical protein